MSYLSISEQLELATNLGTFWHQLMPDLGTPDREQLLLWAGSYTEKNAVYSINRAARKVLKLRDTDAPMTLTDAIKYASSVMKNEKCGIRDFRDFSANTVRT